MLGRSSESKDLSRARARPPRLYTSHLIFYPSGGLWVRLASVPAGEGSSKLWTKPPPIPLGDRCSQRSLSPRSQKGQIEDKLAQPVAMTCPERLASPRLQQGGSRAPYRKWPAWISLGYRQTRHLMLSAASAACGNPLHDRACIYTAKDRLPNVGYPSASDRPFQCHRLLVADVAPRVRLPVQGLTSWLQCLMCPSCWLVLSIISWNHNLTRQTEERKDRSLCRRPARYDFPLQPPVISHDFVSSWTTPHECH